MKILAHKKQVESILKEHPATRDNDMKLLAAMWSKYATTEEQKEFCRRIWSNELPNPESIRRTRQKLQEDNPELRGLKYAKRQRRAKDVQGQLGYGNDH